VSERSDIGHLVEAVQDLTRVIIHLSGKFGSTAEAVRELRELGISPVRVATLLGIQPKQVHSELTKAKKRAPSPRHKR
jgi:hypothetical protein